MAPNVTQAAGGNATPRSGSVTGGPTVTQADMVNELIKLRAEVEQLRAQGSNRAVKIKVPEPKTNGRRPTRNGDCPCGSKKKFKNCCLPAKNAAARTAEQMKALIGDGPLPQSIQVKQIYI